MAAGLLWLEYLDPGVGPIEQPLSAHGLSRYWLVWAETVVLAGLVMMGTAYRWQQIRHARAGPPVLAVAGAAFVIVATFTTDPWYPWQHALTWTGWLHVIGTGAGMGGLALAMLCTLSSAERKERSYAARVARVLGGTYVLLLSGVLLATLVRVVQGNPVYFIGLEERTLLVLALGWLGTRVVIARRSGELHD